MQRRSGLHFKGAAAAPSPSTVCVACSPPTGEKAACLTSLPGKINTLKEFKVNLKACWNKQTNV